jgi:hypothetical protein
MPILPLHHSRVATQSSVSQPSTPRPRRRRRFLPIRTARAHPGPRRRSHASPSRYLDPRNCPAGSHRACESGWSGTAGRHRQIDIRREPDAIPHGHFLVVQQTDIMD